MSQTHKTIFISDLHLEEKRPDITHIFLQLLSNLDSSIDALYILGDLFEAWIGDDHDTLLNREIINSLKSVTQKGVPVYFLYGNRDFLIGNKFLHETGCTLLTDEAKIKLYGTSVLIMHGDTLCTKDQKYIKARKIMRNSFLKKMFLLLPLKLRKKIAAQLRKTSRQHTSTVSAEIMDVTQDEVERIMQKHNVTFLIHGHTHRPGFHQFSLRHSPATRIVLGAWHEKGNMLVWDTSGKKDILEFT
jgi:UDP-2,3-diacylglucosamine hydrolase